jgi:RarD protein
MTRGVIGAAFILIFTLITKKGVDFSAVKKNLPVLIASGAFIGINWILLFEAYKHTSVAVATLCYYTAPLFVTVASAVFFKEKLSPKKVVCILSAIVGMIFVSGIADGSAPEFEELIGILLGIGAALFYASVTLITKKARDVSSFDMTIVQIFFAAIVVSPYSLIFDDISLQGTSAGSLWLVLLVGIIHTGIAYVLYFTSVKKLEASRVAIFSYLDPIVAIILSAIVLKEKITLGVALGALLILLSAFASEVRFSVFKRDTKK